MAGSLLDYLLGRVSPEVLGSNEVTNSGFPQGTLAQFPDIGYGDPNESFINGNVANVLTRGGVPASALEFKNGLADVLMGSGNNTVMPEAAPGDLYANTKRAISHSAIAGLGFDPRHFNLDVVTPADGIDALGRYLPLTDQGFVVANDPSTLAHESTHRGLQEMRKQGSDLDKWLEENGISEEDLVRYVMATQMGDPEGSSTAPGDVRQRRQAIVKFGHNPDKDLQEQLRRPTKEDKMLADIENSAAYIFAKRFPGGPK